MSGLLGAQTAKTSAETTQQETSLNVQSSVAGKVVAVVLGTKRIAGNLIWYGDFTANAHHSSGPDGGKGGSGSSGGSTTYTYTASVMVGLCVGAINGVNRVWSADDEVGLGSLGASVVVKTGAKGQPVWPWLASAHPSEALAYSGLAYVGIAAADLGSSSSLPNWNWEVKGLGTPKVTEGNGAFDIAFPEAISLIVEDSGWGCGLSGIMGGLSDYGAWCDAHGFVMSDDFSDAKSAREVIQGYCRATLAEPVWDGESLTVVPYADQVVVGENATYTPDLTPDLIIDASMLLPAAAEDEGPIKVTRRDPEEFFNYLSVEYRNRADDYNPGTVTATDDGHIATHGQKPGSAISAHFFSSAKIAQHAADLVQAREIGSPAAYEFGVGAVGAILRPMRVVWLNEPEQGFVNYPVRIKEVTEEDAFNFRCTAEEIPGCVGAMVSRVVASGEQGYRSQFNKIPAGCNPPIIFEAPAVLTAGTGLEVWAAISGSDEDWGGCEVWLSTDGDTYRPAGTVYGGARTGSLTAALAVGADPDNVNTLSVSLSESRSQMLSGTRADADLFNTLCWVGGELISYQDAELTGAHAYNLQTYLRRGAYGTEIAAHAVGTRFARLDSAIFRYPYTADMIGQTIHIKALGFNQRQGGLQSLADVDAYTYTITGREPPPAPTALFRSGNRAYWEIADAPGDLVGSRIRHLAGRTRNWDQGMDWPADGAVVTAREIDLSQFGMGEHTIMVRSVDTSRNLSIDTAYLTIGLGEPSPANVIITHDEAGLGFPGVRTNCSVVGGALVADDTGEDFLPDDAALFLPDPVSDFLPLSYKQATYEFTYIPAASDVPGALVLSAAVDAEGWQTLFRRRGSTALFLDRDDAVFLGDDDAAFLGGADPWSPWPGELDVDHEVVDIRLVTEAGNKQGVISALALAIDVDDVTESFEDLVIPAGGGRIPITKTYRAIDFVGAITLQDDGHGAVQILTIDYDPVLGPMLKGVNGAGVSVQATIDIKDLKGH